MAGKGPPKKPTALKVVEGNPGKRPLPDREPPAKRPKRPPAAPAWLSATAKKHWRAIYKLLDDMGVLSVTDLPALGRYIEAWADYLEAKRHIDEKLGGDVYIETKSVKGGNMTRLHPAAQRKNEVATMLLRIEQEFGMTPASRARVKQITGDDDQDDPAAAYMKRAAG